MVAGQEVVSVESAVIGVKNWFSGRQGPWLIVFEGVDSIENREASGFIDKKHFIPNVAGLHVIITSRSKTAQDITRLEGVEVAEMEEAQAVQLFYRYSELQRGDQDVKGEIEAIVQEFGYMALAVTLAATYVGCTRRLQPDIRRTSPISNNVDANCLTGNLRVSFISTARACSQYVKRHTKRYLKVTVRRLRSS
jgi:hypothetical protein